jgi:hypothetical protein
LEVRKMGILDFAGSICYTGISQKEIVSIRTQSESPGVAAPGLSLGQLSLSFLSNHLQI